MIQTAKELATAAENVAKYFKTLYVMGCFGAPMNSKNKERYCRNHSYNRQTERTVKIKAATADTFGFDCVCLIKGVLWGWRGDKNAIYGGATYASNGVPDIGALAGNISQALWTTAGGLVVSIPALTIFYSIRNNANRLILRMTALTMELIKDLRNVEVEGGDAAQA